MAKALEVPLHALVQVEREGNEQGLCQVDAREAMGQYAIGANGTYSCADRQRRLTSFGARERKPV
jgi:hypothetical protein